MINGNDAHERKQQHDPNCTFGTKVKELLGFRQVRPFMLSTRIPLAAFANKDLLPNTQSVGPQRPAKCVAALRAVLVINEYHLPSPRTSRSTVLKRAHPKDRLMAAAYMLQFHSSFSSESKTASDFGRAARGLTGNGFDGSKCRRGCTILQRCHADRTSNPAPFYAI